MVLLKAILSSVGVAGTVSVAGFSFYQLNKSFEDNKIASFVKTSASNALVQTLKGEDLSKKANFKLENNTDYYCKYGTKTKVKCNIKKFKSEYKINEKIIKSSLSTVISEIKESELYVIDFLSKVVKDKKIDGKYISVYAISNGEKIKIGSFLGLGVFNF